MKHSRDSGCDQIDRSRTNVPRRDQIIGVSPFGLPDPRLVAAVSGAGALGVLDLGRDPTRAAAALRLTSRIAGTSFGIRVSEPAQLSRYYLAQHEEKIDTVFWPGDALAGPGGRRQLARLKKELPDTRLLIEITSLSEAATAVDAGADGLLARGSEAGGRIGELSSFVLLQQILEADQLCHGSSPPPVWCWGGVGLRTAVAAVVGGAVGVVLDTQLALLRQASTPAPTAAALRRMDGTETVTAGGHRVHQSAAARRTRGNAESWPTEVVVSSLGGDDPDLRLLPVGEDVFLAREFAARFGTVAKVVQAIRQELDTTADAVGRGASDAAFSGESPLCRALGITRPVAQGPMTRVSDRPGFARRVADDGALPFLALALANGEQSRQLLTETRDLLGDRPWGVGLLGFAPEDLRTAQLEAVRDIRPSCVIVAGGRATQATDLEKIGIPTFLHVPSPVLLRQYLAAGCRRFVFEGSECGGHVGPRASFPLWEAQISVLLDHVGASSAGVDPSTDIQILFAGGVHDARSSAMVAAMARPLIDRGVGVGVLMGTAYLFTEEAVEHGAIQEEFQHQAVAAGRTALLRTAPGHVTRCVESPYVDRFRAENNELRAQGLADEQIWERLEQLNIGRLRVASKGLERRGDSLVPVGREQQRDEGLFMAGQVAVLRSTTTTVRMLHESVTEGARQYLHDQARRLRAEYSPTDPPTTLGAGPLDIAVVGMACVLPGAPDVATYWSNVVAGRDSVTPVPADRWDTEIYFDPEASGPSGERTRSKWGGFLPRIPFDPLRYGIPPSALASIEPVQVLALETARRALEDAGLDTDEVDHTRTGVVFGTEPNSDFSAALTLRALLPAYFGEVPAELDDLLPRVTPETFTGILGNIIASRISNRLDLGGPAYTVDAACASSLAALDMACKELRFGSADVMICGGADLHNGIFDYLMFSSVGALSPTGRARPFAAEADGTTLGEGVACVVLKRLADAERDGDRVYAVIKGVGAASDGRSLGLTAPRPQGQRLALDRAYRAADVSPAQVGLVEAHGTGTVLGDRTEIDALTEVFTEAGAAAGSCALGSVKSQIGHTKTAAALASLVKVSLALHHGVLPPTLHISAPNPAWAPDVSPFVFSDTARPWSPPASERVAGISAFGFGGANYHAVLTGHPGAVDSRHALDEWPAELLLFRGADLAAALRAVSELRNLLTKNDAQGRPWPLRDIAATAAVTQARQGRVQIAVVARDLDDCARLLELAASGGSDPRGGLFVADGSLPDGPPSGKVAVLFPGQGSQRPGMLGELFVAFPELRDYLRLGQAWEGTILPPSHFDAAQGAAADAAERLKDTRIAQPALGVAGLGMYHLLSRLGLTPDLAAGHSYGELVALCVAGAFDAETLLELSAARGEAIIAAVSGHPAAEGAEPDQSAVPDQGAMAAVRATVTAVTSVLAADQLAGRVVLANHNGPDQVVISGPTADVETAIRLLREAGHSAVRLPVACAFHSPLVADAGKVFAAALKQARVTAPGLPVWSNRTAAPYPAADGTGDAVRVELGAQIAAPVRFVEQIEAMYAAGARVFVEAGPGRVLTGLVTSILADRPHVAVACDGRRGGLTGFLDAVGALAVAGVPLRTDWLVDGRDAVDRTATLPPDRHRWSVDGRSICLADGKPVPGGLVPARRVQLSPSGTPAAAFPVAPGAPAAPAPGALVSQFLQTARDNLAGQRDVLLSYLGVDSAPAPRSRSRTELPPAPALHDQTVASPGTSGTPWAAATTTPAVAPAAVPVQAAVPVPVPVAVAVAVAVAPDVTTAVVNVIADGTGYPPDMIEIDLDLETDLSVNSLKRTELAGRLSEQFGFADRSGGVDELSRLRTVRGIVSWITDQTPAPSAPPPPPTIQTDPPGRARGRSPQRFMLTRQPSPAAPGQPDLAGTSWVVIGRGPEPAIETSVAGRLVELGARVSSRVGEDLDAADLSAFDGVLYLAGWGGDLGGPELPGAFGSLRGALRGRLRWLLAVAPTGSTRTAGLRGLFRTISREYPAIAVRLLEAGPDAVPRLADLVVAELNEPPGPAAVVFHDGARRETEALTAVSAGPMASVGAGPADDGAAEAAALGLDRDAVVILIGGARGITAGFTTLLAGAGRCHLELAGSTPAPADDEDPRLAAAVDQQALIRILSGLGQESPGKVARRARLVLAQREIRATLAEVDARGGQAQYHRLDVLDTEAVHQFIKQVHARHGRIDAVVYSAGIIADRLIADKEPEEFRRVYETKVTGARTVLAALGELPFPPRAVVFFGSVAGALGNRGQSDYAAANDALETLGADWQARTGLRALTVHWGPWAPDPRHPGMVSSDLEKDFARRGVDLIDPDEGHRSLLRELAWGPRDICGVVYTASGW
ncbi:type I polyketide synthase [Frankia sp. CH37]|nr:type I polyketide synthase [Parafrankia sp. CH37]